MTAGLLELEETIEHLDFAAACEYEDCKRTAAWVGHCRRCSYSVLLCEAHHAHELILLSCFTFWPVFCLKCHVTVPALQWREIFEFLPIGGEG